MICVCSTRKANTIVRCSMSRFTRIQDLWYSRTAQPTGTQAPEAASGELRAASHRVGCGDPMGCAHPVDASHGVAAAHAEATKSYGGGGRPQPIASWTAACGAPCGRPAVPCGVGVGRPAVGRSGRAVARAPSGGPRPRTAVARGGAGGRGAEPPRRPRERGAEQRAHELQPEGVLPHGLRSRVVPHARLLGRATLPPPHDSRAGAEAEPLSSSSSPSSFSPIGTCFFCAHTATNTDAPDSKAGSLFSPRLLAGRQLLGYRHRPRAGEPKLPCEVPPRCVASPSNFGLLPDKCGVCGSHILTSRQPEAGSDGSNPRPSSRKGVAVSIQQRQSSRFEGGQPRPQWAACANNGPPHAAITRTVQH